ncbi:selT-like protein [Alnus glutinosa]|uniref:selT-like protein n=1 Tax=Alnus glutinosa TaxID=3517 RepID=UPI002D786D47|nr:selT-like protein [Alnus glutinosa]
MDRTQLLLVGLPLFLLFSDLVNLFTPPPPPPPKPIPHSHHHHHHHPSPPVTKESLDFPSQTSGVGGIGLGNTVNINFCASCSYRGSAETMKKMLETAFPGIDVVLANYPPSLPKRLLAKVVPFFQMGVVGMVVAGEQIFPMLGVMAPPPWYYSLRANKFGTIATSWLLGNAAQSFLQSTGAFEVYFNDELVFSKLNVGRFPGEIELKTLIGKRLTTTGIADGLGNLWS